MQRCAYFKSIFKLSSDGTFFKKHKVHTIIDLSIKTWKAWKCTQTQYPTTRQNTKTLIVETEAVWLPVLAWYLFHSGIHDR